MYPLTDGADVTDYESGILELWLGMGERARATALLWWPKQSTPFGYGVVPAGITETTFTDTNANGGLGWDDTATYNNPWQKADDARLVGLAFWFLQIDDCDASKVVKTKVVSHDATNVTYESIEDYVTSGNIPSIASLVGKNYFFLRGDYGETWADRFIDFPNDYQFSQGIVAEFHDDPDHPLTVTNPTTTTFKQKDKTWVVNEHAGRDFLCYAGGKLRRVTVTSNTVDTLTYPVQTWTPQVDQPWCLVLHDARATPGKADVYPYVWYHGGLSATFGHLPEPNFDLDNPYLGSMYVPAGNFEHGEFDSGAGCYTALPPAFDIDYVTENTLDATRLGCGYPPEKFFAPKFHTTLRGLQADWEEIASSYSESISFEGKKAIPKMTQALAFRNWGKNATTTTVTSVDPDVTGTTTIPATAYLYYPCPIFYTVLDDRGRPFHSGAASLVDPTTINSALNDADVGKTIVISTGWDRYFSREVQRMFYGKVCFIPSIAFDGDGHEFVVDPPAIDFATTGCAGAGKWVYKGKSQKYIEQDAFGPFEGDDFQEQELARYVGDNFWDPVHLADPLLAPYWDHFYTGKLGKDHELLRRSQMSGNATSFTRFSLTDDTQSWFDQKWYASGALRMESGTFTSGSPTFGDDSTKVSGAGQCMWDAGRFEGGTPYQWFVVEIDIAGETHKRFIRSGATASLNWVEPLPGGASAIAKNYRIYEPAYELARFRGRKFVMVDAEGTRVEVTSILGNDDTTIFFDDIGVDLVEPVSYEIQEIPTGPVFKRVDGEWVDPGTTDTVRVFVPVPRDFVKPRQFNLPTIVHRYGRMMRGDDPIAVQQQLYYAIKSLKKTPLPFSWTNDPGTGEEDNRQAAVAGNDEHFPRGGYGCADVGVAPYSFDLCDADWLCAGNTFPDDATAWGVLMGHLSNGWSYDNIPADNGCPTDGMPYVNGVGFFGAGYVGATPGPTVDGDNTPRCITRSEMGGSGASANNERVYAYGTLDVSQPYCTIANKVEYYVYCGIDADDPDAGLSCDLDGLGNYTANTATFNSHGDGVLFRQFHSFFTDPAFITSVHRVSGPLSPDKLATPPSSIPFPSTACPTYPTQINNRGGYWSLEWVAVVEWNFQHCV